MTDAELDARLGELLVSSKALDASRVDTARVFQQSRGGTLAGSVLALNLATDKVVRMLLEEITGQASDAPLCMTCGIKMRPSGSCYVCEGCGSTSGCS